MAINSKRDLDKKETCGRCKQTFARRDMRGSRTQGVWHCVPCWEDETGMAAPAPLPVMGSAPPLKPAA